MKSSINLKVSIIIPTFKKPQSLYLTLKSLENQTLSKESYEVIVTNDGRDVETDQVINTYSDRMNISCVYGMGKGPATAKNRALNMAKGTVYLFLDDDVICKPTFLCEHLQYYVDNPYNIVVTAQRRHLYYELNEKKVDQLSEYIESGYFERMIEDSYEDSHCKLLEEAYNANGEKRNASWICLNGCNFSASAYLIKVLNGFDSNLTYLEDTDMGLRLWEYGAEFRYCKSATNFHLEHAIDIINRKDSWERNYPIFREKHGPITAEIYSLFFNGYIDYNTFEEAYIKKEVPQNVGRNRGSYWFWEQLAMRRWRNKKDA